MLVEPTGGVLEFHNHAVTPIRALRIITVVYDEHPDWTWTTTRPFQRNFLLPGDASHVRGEFVDPNGASHRLGVGGFDITFRFTDSENRVWERTSYGRPELVKDADPDAE
ncbi:hypothetical protein [Pseudonocardia sp. WMMC193]|uniref:hypothetical protein n=1 Tax=Pseudonocardia sp. WMMC193 TaxID=2911965 RepID=UPI001F2B940E|nr:hypothetical protein [Pseudonocardia sp. WMMC193]MCF7552586.1 hypothetical protein [Pseudonocardia sp. WMMC193]